MQISNELLKEIQGAEASEYGTFGHIVRMQDEFNRLKSLLGGRRRVKTTRAIRESLKTIAANALFALAIEGEPHASADKR